MRIWQPRLRHFRFCILKFIQHHQCTIWAMMPMTQSQGLELDINTNQKSHLRAARIVFSDFSEYVLANDPDILVSSTEHSRSYTSLDYLFMRMRKLGLDLQLRRDKQTNQIEGRVYLCNDSFHSDLDMAGLIEKARFGFISFSLAARYGISRLIDSRNCYELIQRGFVIPRPDNNNERI